MSAAGDKKRVKELEQRFREYIRKERTHLRVGQQRQDGTEIWPIGTIRELHGPAPDGVCTCCHGRDV